MNDCMFVSEIIGAYSPLTGRLSALGNGIGKRLWPGWSQSQAQLSAIEPKPAQVLIAVIPPNRSLYGLAIRRIERKRRGI